MQVALDPGGAGDGVDAGDAALAARLCRLRGAVRAVDDAAFDALWAPDGAVDDLAAAPWAWWDAGIAVDLSPRALRRSPAAIGAIGEPEAFEYFVRGESAWAIGTEAPAAEWPRATALYHFVRLEDEWRLTARFAACSAPVKSALPVRSAAAAGATTAGPKDDELSAEDTVRRYHAAQVRGDYHTGAALWAPVGWAFQAAAAPAASGSSEDPQILATVGFAAMPAAQRFLWHRAGGGDNTPVLAACSAWEIGDVAWALTADLPREADPGGTRAGDEKAVARDCSGFTVYQLVRLPDAGWRLTGRVQLYGLPQLQTQGGSPVHGAAASAVFASPQLLQPVAIEAARRRTVATAAVPWRRASSPVAAPRDGHPSTHTYNGWVAALWMGTVALAILGQYSFSTSKTYPRDGIFLYGLALVCFLVLLLRFRQDVFGSDRWTRTTTRAGAVSLADLLGNPVRMALVIASGTTAYMTVGMIQGKSGAVSYWDAFWLWFTSSSLLIVAFLPADLLAVSHRTTTFGQHVRRWAREHTADLLTASLLTAAAGILRFVALGAVPDVVSGDEGRIGSLALSAMSGQLANMFSTTFGHSTMYLFLMSVPYHVFGVNPAALRVSSAVAGTLTVPVTYVLAGRMFDRRTAFIAATLVATSHIHIHFSRVAVAGSIMDALLTPLAVYLFYRAVTHGRPLDFLLSGVAVSAYLFIYMGARLTFLFLLAAGVVVVALEPRRFRALGAGLVVFLGAAAIVGAPMLLWMYQHPQEFMARANQVGIFPTGWLAGEIRRTGQAEWRILLQQFWKSVLVFNYYPATGFYNSALPMLDYVTAVPFVLGLFYAGVRTLERRFLLLNAWVWSSVIAGQALLVAPEGGAYRILIVIPAAMVLAAVGFTKLLELGKRVFVRSSRAALPLAAFATAAFLMVSSYVNLRYYFADFAPKCTYEDTGTRIASALGSYMRGLDRESKVYLYGAPVLLYGVHPSVDFLSGRLPAQNVDQAQSARLDYIDPGKRPVFVFIPDRMDEAAAVQRLYPAGQWSDIISCGRTVLRAYKPSV